MKNGRIGKRYSLVAGALTVSVVLAAQDSTVHHLSLRQAVDYAGKHNVQVRNALLDIQAQDASNREVTAAAYPQLNGSIGATYNPNVATQTFPNFIAMATYGVLVQEDVRKGNGNPIVPPADYGLIQAQFGTRWTASAGLDLSQILFDGQVFVGLQARATSMQFREKALEVTTENIKANIYKVYYQLVVSRTQVDLLDANIARLDKLLHDTRVIYENGFAEKLDVDKLSVQIANLQTERQKVLAGISNGYYGLKLLLGMPIRDTLILTDSLSDEQIKDGILENGVYTYADRKDYQYAELGRKLNEFNVRRYQLSRYPTVSLTSGYSKNAQRNQFDFYKGPYFTFSNISLHVNVPIFHGFATKARISEARIALEQSRNQLEYLKLSIDNDVEQARNNFRTAIEAMDYQKKNLALAETVYEQTKKKYEVGTGSNTEITAAQTDLKTAQSNYINALYDAIIARVDYLKATGKLD
ncbi:MAG TPA: TolC family protein [Chitinophagaceae bacterium]|nr:TolC family protein [Chitinophagaceae bacterium]